MNPYIGNEFQLYGVEEYTLHNGYQEGVKMLHAKNGIGLDMTISLDRGGDIVSLSLNGKNVSFITPNGIRHHMNYEPNGDGWIKHFTAGFLTTCGFQNVGSPCNVGGKEYPLHGSINYIPVSSYSYEMDDENIVIKMITLDESIFSRKIKRVRTISISKSENSFSIKDDFENRGGEDTELLVLYHMNIGYPLLKEDSVIHIDYDNIVPRNEHSKSGVSEALHMQKPTSKYEEMCFFYETSKINPCVEIYSPSEKFGLRINYNSKELPCFTEWKMMGVRDYVLGLEPGNVTPEGYKINKEKGRVVILKPDEKLSYQLQINLFE